ncbi:hypothetical protein AMTR_s00033p00121580 [Amborella trichopoda]|uniref:Uncharacterized protein n=1 Tax=Amborella trichopoda TaxID=13333 RepID=U5D1I5_AMBTC|nr:hypothetical protein AMTR_s00033p00121580 [Amborella trichopoda]
MAVGRARRAAPSFARTMVVASDALGGPIPKINKGDATAAGWEIFLKPLSCKLIELRTSTHGDIAPLNLSPELCNSKLLQNFKPKDLVPLRVFSFFEYFSNDTMERRY